jgi:hypothetical protein
VIAQKATAGAKRSNRKDNPMSTTNNEKYSERASWPGMLLRDSEWRWFDCQATDDQIDYYRYMTRVERVEA